VINAGVYSEVYMIIKETSYSKILHVTLFFIDITVVLLNNITMSKLNYSSEKKGGITLIRIGGSLDIDTTPSLKKNLDEEIKKGAKKIVCNMGKLDYIASIGLGALINANQILTEKGGEFRISAMNEKIKKIFKLLGFINIFKIYPDDEKATASF